MRSILVMICWETYCTWCVYFASVPHKISLYAKKEDELLNDLFKEYQKWVRPVETLNGTVQVKFGLAISQLVDVVNIDYFVLKIFRTRAQVCSSRCFILFFIYWFLEVKILLDKGLYWKVYLNNLSTLFEGWKESADDDQCMDEAGNVLH